MNKVLILLVIFLAIVYVYSYIKLKKSREKTKSIDTVKHFHNTYKHLTGVQQSPSKREKQQYNNYVTKYNSSEDYREKS